MFPDALSAFPNIVPLRAIALQSLFLLMAIAIEATVLHRQLKMAPKPSIYYAAATNLFCVVLGWLALFIFLNLADVLPLGIQVPLVSFIFFDQWSSETATLLIVACFIIFFVSIGMKLLGLLGLRLLLEFDKKPEEKKPGEKQPNAPQPDELLPEPEVRPSFFRELRHEPNAFPFRNRDAPVCQCLELQRHSIGSRDSTSAPLAQSTPRPITAVAFLKRFLEHIKKQFDGVKPFSWQVSLLLSLFSWFTYLLIRDPAVRQFVSLFGWFFLIIGTEWALIKAKFVVPGLKLEIRYGPWITGAIASSALWSNNIIIQDAQGAFEWWPLLSVGFAAFPRFLKPGPTFKRPDADARRDLVILTLVGLVLSCWFRFHFLLQDFLGNYPSLAADNMNRSAFVVRVNPNSVPASGGVAILDAAEAIVRSELSQRSWADGQRWLNSMPSQFSILGSQALSAAYQTAPSLKETNLWRFTAQFSPSIPTNLLQMQTTWLGPSSQLGGYVLQKACSISESPVQQFVDGLAAGVALPTPYRMDCGAIESSLPGVNVKKPEPLMQQTGNFFERLINAILDLLRGFVDLLGRILGIGRQ